LAGKYSKPLKGKLCNPSKIRLMAGSQGKKSTTYFKIGNFVSKHAKNRCQKKKCP
jgi:hypothetical protein